MQRPGDEINQNIKTIQDKIEAVKKEWIVLNAKLKSVSMKRGEYIKEAQAVTAKFSEHKKELQKCLAQKNVPVSLKLDATKKIEVLNQLQSLAQQKIAAYKNIEDLNAPSNGLSPVKSGDDAVLKKFKIGFGFAELHAELIVYRDERESIAEYK